MKGILPAKAMPAAAVAKFCSATPTWINRSGNFCAKASVRVDSVRSAHKATTFLFFSPASTKPFPYPLLVGPCSMSSSNNFSERYAFFLIIIIPLCFGAGLYFFSPRLQFLQRHLELLFFRHCVLRAFSGRHSMPLIPVLHKTHPFPRNSICHNKRWLVSRSLSLGASVNNLFYIMAVDFNNVPVKRLVLFLQRIQGHNIFGIAINLNIVSIYDLRKIV